MWFLLFINLSRLCFASNFTLAKTVLTLEEILIPMQDALAFLLSCHSVKSLLDQIPKKCFTVISREYSSHGPHFA